MKLSRALKEKKRLAADIAHLKQQINSKNSYVEGSNTPRKFNTHELYANLQSKVQELVNLKIVINEANREIQSSIYLLSEYKAMIDFLRSLPVDEGPIESYRTENIVIYQTQFDELDKEEMIKEFQDKADRLQDQIDTYNYTTEVAWGEDYNVDDKEDK